MILKVLTNLNLIWAIILWSAVLILVPLERIKQLWKVVVITSLWFLVVNFFSNKLGYYDFHKALIPILGSNFFQLVGGAGGGILLMNWMPRSPLGKIFMLVLSSGFFTLIDIIFIRLGYLSYGKFDLMLSFIHSLAMISILIWLNIGIAGRETIYEGNKSRFDFSKIF